MKIILIFFIIGFVISLVVWGYEVYRIIRYGDDVAKMWIALAFVWICVFGTKVFG